LKAVVYEDKNIEGIKESSRLSQRQFDNRWLNPTQQKVLIDASVTLRPNMDDFTKVYRPM
jgi:hypothetical protein